MPIYEYRCMVCGYTFEELILRSSDPSPSRCPKCGENLMKLISESTFHLHGYGWTNPTHDPIITKN